MVYGREHWRPTPLYDQVGDPHAYPVVWVDLVFWDLQYGRSKVFSAVNDEEQIPASVRLANRIWAQAGIQFRIRKIDTYYNEDLALGKLPAVFGPGVENLEDLLAGRGEVGDDPRTPFGLDSYHWERGQPWINIYYLDRFSFAGFCALDPNSDLPSIYHHAPRHTIAIHANNALSQAGSNFTLAHELGHYFNLEHTFADSLDSTATDSGFFADARAEREVHWGDPWNVMSYPHFMPPETRIDDSDLHLTEEQILRARRSLFSDRAEVAGAVLGAIGS